MLYTCLLHVYNKKIILNVDMPLLVSSPYVTRFMLGHGLFKIRLDVLNRDRKLAKSDCQLVITVHSTARTEQIAFTAQSCMKFDI